MANPTERQIGLLFERYSFALIASTIVGVSASVAQIVFEGANAQLITQFAAASVLCLSLLLRNQISTKLLIGCIYSFIFLFVIAGSVDDGLAEPSLFILATLPLTSTIIWGLRSGLVTSALVIASVCAMAAFFIVLTPAQFVLDDYLHAPHRWALFVLALSIAITLSLVIAETQRRYWLASVNELEEEVARRKRSEDEIRLSEKRYRALIEYAPESISMFDAKTGKYIDVNPATEKTLGYSREELIDGMSPSDTAPEYQPNGRASAKAAADYLRRAGEGEMPRFEWTSVDRQGTQLVQEVHLARIPDRKRVLVRATSQDITERKKTEERLARSERELRQLVEGSVQGILVMDKNLKPLFANEELARIFKYGSGDHILDLASAEDLIAPENLERFAEIRTQLDRDSEGPLRFEVTGITDSGARIVLDCIMGQISWDGRNAIQLTMHDITEKSRFDELLRKSQRMDSIGRLTAGIAHDFNNLLYVIQGNAENLVTDDEKQPEQVSEILGAVEQGADLTRRLLTYASQQKISFNAIDVVVAVEETVRLLRRTFPSNITITIEMVDDLWFVWSNRNQIKDAILNLAINARDAMPHGGKIKIQCKNVEINTLTASQNPDAGPGEYVEIAITDTGHGISRNDAARVFEPFYTSKSLGDGTGLGLSMIYGFARQSGGFVSVDSELGHGSTFALFLPRAEPEKAEPDAEPVSEKNTGKGQAILVVDDNPAARKLLIRMVRDLGFSPIAANDAEAGASIIAGRDDIALVVSDVMLGGEKSGSDFAKELLLDCRSIGIVLISGNPRGTKAEHDQSGDRIEILAKPFRAIQLAEAIAIALNAAGASEEAKE